MVLTKAFVQSVISSVYGLLIYLYQSSHDHQATILALVVEHGQRIEELLFLAATENATGTCNFGNLSTPDACNSTLLGN